MPYRIAGIDVHKRMLAVVIADVAVEGEYPFDRRTVGTSPAQLRGAGRVARGVRGRGSRDGIDRAILASRMGGARSGSGNRAVARARAPLRVVAEFLCFSNSSVAKDFRNDRLNATRMADHILAQFLRQSTRKSTTRSRLIALPILTTEGTEFYRRRSPLWAGATPTPGSPPGSPKAPQRGVAPARSAFADCRCPAAKNAAHEFASVGSWLATASATTR